MEEILSYTDALSKIKQDDIQVGDMFYMPINVTFPRREKIAYLRIPEEKYTVPFVVLGRNQNRMYTDKKIDFIDIMSMIPIFRDIQFSSTLWSYYDNSFISTILNKYVNLPNDLDNRVEERYEKIMTKNRNFDIISLGKIWLPAAREIFNSRYIYRYKTSDLKITRQYMFFKLNHPVYLWKKCMDGTYRNDSINFWTRTTSLNTEQAYIVMVSQEENFMSQRLVRVRRYYDGTYRTIKYIVKDLISSGKVSEIHMDKVSKNFMGIGSPTCMRIRLH